MVFGTGDSETYRRHPLVGVGPARSRTRLLLAHSADPGELWLSRGGPLDVWVSGVLEPIPLISLLATSLSLRVVFEEGLFGYKFMALAVMLILLAIVRGQIRGRLMAWLALATLAFNPIPAGHLNECAAVGRTRCGGASFGLHRCGPDSHHFGHRPPKGPLVSDRLVCHRGLCVPSMAPVVSGLDPRAAPTVVLAAGPPAYGGR